MNTSEKVTQQATRAATELARSAAETAERVAIACNDIQYIKQDIAEINEKLDAKYVTRDEFTPVARIVYGLVTAILLAVVGALLSLIIIK